MTAMHPSGAAAPPREPWTTRWRTRALLLVAMTAVLTLVGAGIAVLVQREQWVPLWQRDALSVRLERIAGVASASLRRADDGPARVASVSVGIAPDLSTEELGSALGAVVAALDDDRFADDARSLEAVLPPSPTAPGGITLEWSRALLDDGALETDLPALEELLAAAPVYELRYAASAESWAEGGAHRSFWLQQLEPLDEDVVAEESRWVERAVGAGFAGAAVEVR